MLKFIYRIRPVSGVGLVVSKLHMADWGSFLDNLINKKARSTPYRVVQNKRK